jgi:predicted RNA-binding Zn-ribbon protein involved in translation (DUF1610 family)
MHDYKVDNGVIIGKTKSGITWLCPNCGEGGLGEESPKLAEKRAKKHKCPSDLL